MDLAHLEAMTAELDLSLYRALVLDMDGVITRTAAIHAEAWKRLFDDLLRKRAKESGKPFEPFDKDRDYRTYVDGKPRLDGLQSFLAARGIEVPQGEASDPASAETINGLGKRKNEIFHELVEERGVEIFPGSVLLTGLARIGGLRAAVVTSSRNGRFIMERSGLLDLFDALVDGNVAADLGLEGKPHPDIMLEATKRLNVNPGEAILVEDALSGVESGRAAGMGLVVGVARSGNAVAMQEAGADLVLKDAAQLKPSVPKPRPMSAVPPGMAYLDTLSVVSSAVDRTAIFLDYDGTLTPIVARPELARLSEDMRTVVARLAEDRAVAIISGRDLQDVRSLVGIDSIYYAGSHGFDVAGPGGMRSLLEKGRDAIPLIDEVEQRLRHRLGRIEGLIFERKRFSLAVHFRLAPAEAEGTVNRVVREVLAEYPGLRQAGGKKVVEVQPAIDWDKGKALEWLLQQLEIDPGRSLAMYLGDDLTDEDAFRALSGWGLGVVVRDGGSRQTHADLALADTREVGAFLEALRTHPRTR